jgi:light-regulated signal transduction histidine kinase (bacteriophytochrome)
VHRSTGNRPVTIPTKRGNTVPTLIDTLRPNLPTVAKWLGVARWKAQRWQQGERQPELVDRARLVKVARKHAHELLALADAVEREGKSQHGGQ